MENLEQDMQKLVLDMLAKQVQGEDISKKTDDVNTTRLKEENNADTTDKKGKDLTSSTSTVTDRSSEEKLSLCPVCDAAAEKTCGACKSVSYCSVEHQRLHWKSHKNVCSPFIIKETETMGKGWFAARDLPADAIILDELPVLSGPTWDALLHFCCVGCGIEVINTQNENRKCSTCSWPICSTKCEKSSLHAENECKFFSTHKMTPSNSDPISPWQRTRVLLIRANNLKLKNKKLFDKIMELQDFKVMQKGSHKLNSEALVTLMNEQFIVRRTHLTDEEYAKLVRIFGVNCFVTNPAAATETSAEMNVLYLESSRMNYSCAPNCVLSTGTSPDFKARVRTSVAVKKGESLTISYYDKLPIKPTSIRQQYLQNEIGFMCKCKRCLDPTELGTFVSGITCQSCRHVGKSKNEKGDNENFGYFLPENPLDLSFDSKSGSLISDPLFKCNGCGGTKPFSELKSSLPFEIQEAFEVFNMDYDVSTNIKKAEAFLDKYFNETGGKYLHKNHYLIQTITKKIFATPIEGSDKGLSKLELERDVRRLDYLLQIRHMLFPGLSEHKASIFISLMSIVCLLLLKFPQELKVHEILKLTVIAETCYTEGMKYFKKDNSVDAQPMIQKLQHLMNLLKP